MSFHSFVTKITFLFAFFCATFTNAQKFSSDDLVEGIKNEINSRLSAYDYINTFKEDAVKEMYLHKIPASIVLAQALFESDNGNSELARFAKNHFGIKCKLEWNGDSYTKDDEEKNECFRKYNSVLESYSDHSQFLKSRPRYAFLFDIPLTDYKSWCYGLKEAGYATDPNYAIRLINIIEKYKLYEFDQQKPIDKPDFPIVDLNTKEPDLKVVYQFNKGKFLIIKEGDSFFKIAIENNLEIEKLLEYNDIKPGETIKIGQKLYLEPKNDQAKEPYHLVQQGETLHSISQIHGIKMEVLCKNNHLKPNNSPKPGEILYLRGKKPFTAIHLTSKDNYLKENF